MEGKVCSFIFKENPEKGYPRTKGWGFSPLFYNGFSKMKYSGIPECGTCIPPMINQGDSCLFHLIEERQSTLSTTSGKQVMFKHCL